VILHIVLRSHPVWCSVCDAGQMWLFDPFEHSSFGLLSSVRMTWYIYSGVGEFDFQDMQGGAVRRVTDKWFKGYFVWRAILLNSGSCPANLPCYSGCEVYSHYTCATDMRAKLNVNAAVHLNACHKFHNAMTANRFSNQHGCLRLLLNISLSLDVDYPITVDAAHSEKLR
jgi:hypothetical protein